MPYVDVEGLSLHYERYGSGPIPVVLVHGNFASARWWTTFAPRLPGDDFTAYAVDLRGCGESDRPKDGFGIPRLAYDVFLFAKALGLVRYHLVGHSLGAAVAVQLVLDHPGAVQTLTLLAPSPADGLDGLRQGKGDVAELIGLWDPQHRPSMTLFSVMLQWSRATGVSRRRVVKSLRAMMPTADLDPDEMDRLVDDAELLNPETVIGFYRALHRWDVRARLADIAVPVLLVGGGRDPIVPKDALTIMVGHLPRGRQEIWDDVGHSPQLEAPVRLAALFDRFVTKHAPRVRWWRWARRWRISKLVAHLVIWGRRTERLTSPPKALPAGDDDRAAPSSTASSPR